MKIKVIISDNIFTVSQWITVISPTTHREIVELELHPEIEYKKVFKGQDPNARGFN